MTARRAALLGGAGGALVTAAVAAVLVVAGAFDSDEPAGRVARQPAQGPARARTPRPEESTAASDAVVVGQVYRRAIASVVLIRTGDGEGSGFVVDATGRIVTNA